MRNTSSLCDSLYKVIIVQVNNINILHKPTGTFYQYINCKYRKASVFRVFYVKMLILKIYFNDTKKCLFDFTLQ